VMKEAPETYCIVFSGFNEFDYVKRAIQLGVADYLEKPITVQSIKQAIVKMLERVRKQKDSQHELLEKAALDLLLIGAEAESKWKEHFGTQASKVVAVTVLAHESETFPWMKDPHHIAVTVRNEQQRLLVVFHLACPLYDFWEKLFQEAEHAGTVAGVGRTYAHIGEARDSFKEALRALRAARFLNEIGLVRFEDLGGMITGSEELPEREESIILSLRSGNRTGLLEQINRFIEWFEKENVDPELAEREMLKFIYIAQQMSKEAGTDKKGKPYDNYRPHVEIREMMAKGEMVAWFREQIKRIADSVLNIRENSKHATIERARAYMEQHYSKDVSLQEVAEHIGMNSSYISVLFKEVMGESYIKYLTRYRIEAAKSLLNQGLKVNEVSEQVGYHTYRHFSEVFKKYTGATPGQYKDQLVSPTDSTQKTGHLSKE
ncbi:MAG: helix-turn-helix domain-containing protein, partial [Paenibacillaceae bacterium]